MLLSERYHRPSDLPHRIPVFPLRGVILLPRASLPLTVFEPRYLAMLDDVLAGDRIIGIVQPDRASNPDDDVESPTGSEVSLRGVGCAGRVTAFQEIDDGRVMITLTGIARYKCIDERPSGRPYRICKVSYDHFAHDLDEGLGEDEVDREQLLSVLKTYLEARQLNADWRSIARASTEFLINSLSVISPYGAEEKQALLESIDLKMRAEVLVALAEMDLAGGDGGGPGTTLQ